MRAAFAVLFVFETQAVIYFPQLKLKNHYMVRFAKKL